MSVDIALLQLLRERAPESAPDRAVPSPWPLLAAPLLLKARPPPPARILALLRQLLLVLIGTPTLDPA